MCEIGLSATPGSKGEVLFTIDGEPLQERLRSINDGLTLQELPPNTHLLGEPSADLTLDGRAALLICPMCGDLGCGAELARIEIGEDTVTWRDFIYGNHDPAMDKSLDCEFVFDRQQYEDELRRAAV